VPVEVFDFDFEPLFMRRLLRIVLRSEPIVPLFIEPEVPVVPVPMVPLFIVPELGVWFIEPEVPLVVPVVPAPVVPVPVEEGVV
jgi:hypothetical protein